MFRIHRLAVLALICAFISLSVLSTRAEWTHRTLTLYSDRDAALIEPLIDRFIFETGIKVEVHYRETVDLNRLMLSADRVFRADIGYSAVENTMMSISGVGIISAGSRADLAQQFADYLLNPTVQQYLDNSA